MFNDIHIISFQVLSLILGMQECFTKYTCFLCLWDSQADDNHYMQNGRPSREILQADSHNIVVDSLVKLH